MRMRFSIAVLGMVVAVGVGCGRGGGRLPAPLAPVLSSARLYYDDGPAYTDSVRLVVRDVTTWQQVWSQATSTQGAPPPLPEVDFGREMVLVVGAGQMHPGDQIHVDSVGVRQDVYVAIVRTITACRQFPTPAYPLEIVRVARSARQVTWSERRDRAADCR